MQTSIDMHVGDVVVGAHGNVTADHLVEILSTVALLDEAQWSALVDEVVTEP